MAANPSIIHNHIVVLSIRMGLQMILAAVAKDHGVKYSETNLMRNEQTQYLSLKVAKARLGKTWMSVWPLLPNLTESLLPNLCYAL